MTICFRRYRFSNTNIGNLGYSWDANKNKTAETIAGVMSGYGFTSAGTAYDYEDRLTGYQRASGSLNQSWSSDICRRLVECDHQRHGSDTNTRPNARTANFRWPERND